MDNQNALNTISIALLKAQIQVESGGDDNAIGDNGKGFGCLQVHQPVVDHVNAALGTIYLASETVGNRDLSVIIWTTYFQKCYPQFTTDEQKAKCWNGGPGFAAIEALPVKTPLQQAYCDNIADYWSKVSALINA